MTIKAIEVSQASSRDKIHDSFPIFDWLRFFLASVVALSHEGLIGWDRAGNFAVQVFFALSGWLIGGILIRTNRDELPRFYFNRATRIWLPYFGAVLTLYGLSAVMEGLNSDFFHFLVIDLTFTHNFLIDIIPEVTRTMPFKGTGNHFWSISVEEQFYLAAPLMIVLFAAGKTTRFWVMVAIAAVVSRWWYGAISLGVLAAVARENFGDWHSRFRSLLMAVGFASAATFYWMPTFYEFMAPIFAAVIVLLCAARGRRSALGEFAGGVSYPLYLYHWVGAFALSFAIHHGLNPPVISAYLVSVLAGVVMYLLIDRNVMTYRKLYYSPQIGKLLTVTAYALFLFGLCYGSRGLWLEN